jgi:hypothetical protein
MEQIIQIDNKFYKEAQIVILPTDKSQICLINFDDGIGINGTSESNNSMRLGSDSKSFVKRSQDGCNIIPQHLYILSDDEIKEGDWYYCDGPPHFDRINHAIGLISFHETVLPFVHKIIASTDPSLDLLPISLEFLAQYVQAEGIDKVLVQQDRFFESYSYGENEYSYEPSTTQGFIDLRVMPAKDSWSREEVEEIIRQVYVDGYERANANQHWSGQVEEKIKEYLK